MFDFINGFHDSANSIGKGAIDVSIVTPNVILGGLLGAIVWGWIMTIPAAAAISALYLLWLERVHPR